MDNFWILFLVFTIYSFLGWLTESIFCSIPAGKFINRGFLNGPFCPIYGVGGVIVVSVLTPFKGNLLALYLTGVILTTLLEYVTGFALEKTFHTKYWDYSTHRFNIQGRICLENSLLFGVMCVVGILFIHPALMRILYSIPALILPFISGGFILYFISDTVLTVHTIFQLNGKLDEMQQVLDEIKEKASALKAEKIENLQAALGGLIDEETKAAYLKALYELYLKKDKIEEEVKFFQCRVISAFPTMKSLKCNESLQRMKEVIQDKTKNIRRG
nr:putative ABC transporter permease [uncultured Caproiciproducens sp.]